MIRTLKLVSITVLLLIPTWMNAQDFQGVATYKSHRKMDFKMNGKQNSELQKSLQAQITKQFQQEYTLTFDRESSIYKKEESLAAPAPSAGGMQIRIADGQGVLYKNIKENRFTNKTEFYGKLFRIKDTLSRRAWVMGSETKNIGEYTCYKATITDTIKSRTMTEEGELKEIEKERITTAWYTPQIPVSSGPSTYHGLPGLILEINDGSMTLICSKIVLNPKEKITITEPKKGKEISQTKFNVMQEKRMKENMERFRSRRGRDGESQMIFIGG